jgi:hypothetical protein
VSRTKQTARSSIAIFTHGGGKTKHTVNQILSTLEHKAMCYKCLPRPFFCPLVCRSHSNFS